MVAIDSSALSGGPRAVRVPSHALPIDVGSDSESYVGRHRAEVKAALGWRRMLYTPRHRR